MSQYKFQATTIEFDFRLDDADYWVTDCRTKNKRSLDGIEWEIAEISARVIDKDYANAIMTCWQFFTSVTQECGGDLFNYQHSKITRESLNELEETLEETE